METKFEDSNIALLGSDFEKELRKQRAEAEPEWKKAGLEPGIQIWRIEKFNVVPWPKEEYGNFFSGDTYIVLNTQKKAGSDALEYTAHMWVGSKTSVDEAGTGAYKIVELDDHLNRAATLVYEPQNGESELFNSYFKTIVIMEGGIETGFKKVPVEEYKPRLLKISGKGNNVHSSEVPLRFKSLCGEDAFVLDAGLKIFVWKGKDSSSFEKFHAASVAEKLKGERNGKAQVIQTEQGERNPDFIKLFGEGIVEEIAAKRVENLEAKKGSHKVMLKLKIEDMKLDIEDVKFDKSSLESKDSFLIDRGDAIFIWIGKDSNKLEKKFAIVFGQKYLKSKSRAACVPIIILEEGKLQEEIDKCFA